LPGAEHEILPDRGRNAGQHLDRWGHTPVLDPADGLLGGAGPVRQRGLAEAVPCSKVSHE
jgi:hypothetical protein